MAKDLSLSKVVKYRAEIPILGMKAFNRPIYYSIFAYKGVNVNDKNFKNFQFGKNLLYGRIDHWDVPIIIDDSGDKKKYSFKSLLSQDDSSNSHSCLDFVADAFNDMLKEFKKASLSKKITVGKKYDTLKPTTSYIAPKMLHTTVNKLKYQSFLDHLEYESKDNKIFNFKTFLTYFFEYLEDTVHGAPLTMTGFVKSNYCSPNISGLVIDLDSSSHMMDNAKVKQFIRSPNFCFFASAALKYGFYIDRNAPWRLIADLSSPAMLEYMSKNSIADHTIAFQHYYEPAHYYGFEEFKNFVHKTYNSYVRKRSLITLTYSCPSGAIRQKLVKRMPIGRADFDLLYDDIYWIEKYIIIRNIEEMNHLSDSLRDQLIADAKSLLGSQSKSKEYVLDMIENTLVNFEDKSGSLSNRESIKRLRDRGKDATIVQSTSPGARGSFGGGGY